MTTNRLSEALDDLATEAGSYARVDAVLAGAGRRRQRRTVAAAAVLAVALGGGAFAVAGPAREPAPGSETGRWESCAEQADLGSESDGLPRLADDFDAVAVVVCTGEQRRREDRGVDFVMVERRSTDVAALVSALRLPAVPTPTLTGVATVCRAARTVVPWFALLDPEGRWVRLSPPLNPCGEPRKEVLDALDALALTEVSSTVIREIVSARAGTLGCEQEHADAVAMAVTGKPRTGSGINPLAGAQQVRLCVYTVPTDQRGLPKPRGDFAHGRILEPQERDQIGQSLATSGPARTCSGSASRFALLVPVARSNEMVYVELDGCQRILNHPPNERPFVSQGGDALTRLLDTP